MSRESGALTLEELEEPAQRSHLGQPDGLVFGKRECCHCNSRRSIRQRERSERSGREG
jgi:hypothetical protein